METVDKDGVSGTDVVTDKRRRSEGERHTSKTARDEPSGKDEAHDLQYKDLSQTDRALENSNDALKQEISALRRQAEIAKTKAERLAAALAMSKTEVTALYAQVKYAEETAIAYRQSMSWRVSAPVRILGRGVRVVISWVKPVLRPLADRVLYAARRYPVLGGVLRKGAALIPPVKVKLSQYAALRPNAEGAPLAPFHSGKTLEMELAALNAGERATRVLEMSTAPIQSYPLTQLILKDLYDARDLQKPRIE